MSTLWHRLKFSLFVRLLRWYCTEGLDQWSRWHLRTPAGGDVFVTIDRVGDEYHWDELRLDGPFARVDKQPKNAPKRS